MTLISLYYSHDIFRDLRSIWLIHLRSLTCVCYDCLCCFIFIHMWSRLGNCFDAFLCQIPLIHIELNLVCLLLNSKFILPLRYSFYDSMACIQLQVHFDDFWEATFLLLPLCFLSSLMVRPLGLRIYIMFSCVCEYFITFIFVLPSCLHYKFASFELCLMFSLVSFVSWGLFHFLNDVQWLILIGMS